MVSILNSRVERLGREVFGIRGSGVWDVGLRVGRSTVVTIQKCRGAWWPSDVIPLYDPKSLTASKLGCPEEALLS